MNKILANKLNAGDLISIVAPSSGLAPFAMHRIDKAKASLERMGFRVKFEKHSLLNMGYVSATAEDRAADLHAAFENVEVKAVICLIGGDHSNQILKYIDWDIIKNNPKVFVGYSDITVLHNAIYKKTGLVTFYGPCVMVEIGEFPEINSYIEKYFIQTLMRGELSLVEQSEQWTDEFLDWFKGEDLKRGREYKNNSGYEWWKKGCVESELFGGCVPSLNHLLGSEYWNDMNGKVAFIDLPEGENPGTGLSFSALDSFLADLDNANVFRNIKGLIIGRPYGYKDYDADVLILKNLIHKYTNDTNYPILFGVDLGHTSPIITLPFGVGVKLDSEKNLFQITDKYIS